MSVTGVILAAGESRRMGSAKALLRYRGETFLDTLVGLFSERCAPVIVVLGAGADEIRRRAARPARFVVNPDYARGMTSSLKCGLEAAPAESEGVLLTLVDHPAVAGLTLEALLAVPRPLVRVPRYGDERGHPIWFRRELIPEFLALSDGGAANQVVHRHRVETEFLDLDDFGIVADVDDPEAYRKLMGRAV